MGIDGVNQVDLNTVKTESLNNRQQTENIVLFKSQGGGFNLKEPLSLIMKTSLQKKFQETFPQYEIVSITYDEESKENLVKIKMKEDTFPVKYESSFLERLFLGSPKEEEKYYDHTLGSIKSNFGIKDNVFIKKGKILYGNAELLNRIKENDKNPDHYQPLKDGGAYLWNRLSLKKGDEINIPLSEIDINKFLD